MSAFPINDDIGHYYYCYSHLTDKNQEDLKATQPHGVSEWRSHGSISNTSAMPLAPVIRYHRLRARSHNPQQQSPSYDPEMNHLLTLPLLINKSNPHPPKAAAQYFVS